MVVMVDMVVIHTLDTNNIIIVPIAFYIIIEKLIGVSLGIWKNKQVRLLVYFLNMPYLHYYSKPMG
jgi:hypothetical protein